MNSDAQSAYITPRMITWARKRAGYSVQQLAAALRVERQNVEAWEGGNQLPSFKKAGEAAGRLRIPFGFLFLSEPPHEDMPLPDLRTVGNVRPSNPSLDFREVVNDAVLRQQWYSDYLREGGARQIPFVGSCGIGDGPEEVAARMRKSLHISEKMREECDSWEQLLARIAARAEDVGVMVMQRGVVGNNNRRQLSVGEFRGFAIADGYAPLVFVNARDARAARIFTIVHELCHLWIGKSGISNPNLRVRSTAGSNAVERFCNEVAAEVLVPRSSFEREWRSGRSLEGNVRNMAAHFLVSRYVVARRAYDLGAVEWEEYAAYLKENPTLWRAGGGTGGNFYRTFFARNGRRFTSGVLGALSDSKISYREASVLLDQKIATVKKIAERLW